MKLEKCFLKKDNQISVWRTQNERTSHGLGLTINVCVNTKCGKSNWGLNSNDKRIFNMLAWFYWNFFKKAHSGPGGAAPQTKWEPGGHWAWLGLGLCMGLLWPGGPPGCLEVNQGTSGCGTAPRGAGDSWHQWERTRDATSPGVSGLPCPFQDCPLRNWLNAFSYENKKSRHKGLQRKAPWQDGLYGRGQGTFLFWYQKHLNFRNKEVPNKEMC